MEGDGLAPFDADEEGVEVRGGPDAQGGEAGVGVVFCESAGAGEEVRCGGGVLHAGVEGDVVHHFVEVDEEVEGAAVNGGGDGVAGHWGGVAVVDDAFSVYCVMIWLVNFPGFLSGIYLRCAMIGLIA